MKNIQFDTSHYGEYKSNAEEFGYKTIVISGPIQGQKGVKFGRLIQVRKKSGAFGSDTVLVRESDGGLQSFHNMGFFSVSKEFLSLYEKAMEDVDKKNVDKENDEYDIEGKVGASGFVILGLDDTDGKIYSCATTVHKK